MNASAIFGHLAGKLPTSLSDAQIAAIANDPRLTTTLQDHGVTIDEATDYLTFLRDAEKMSMRTMIARELFGANVDLPHEPAPLGGDGSRQARFA